MTTTNKMHPDLEWLAREVSEWNPEPFICDDPNDALIRICGGGKKERYCGPNSISARDPLNRLFTRAQWQDARKELGLDDGGWSEWIKNTGVEPNHEAVIAKFRSGYIAEENVTNEYYWELDGDETDIIAYRYKLKDNTCTPEEEEAWQEKEKLAAMATMSGPDKYTHKQIRYQDAKGEDWIDEFARTATVDEFRGAMRFTLGKYNRRAGKKDELIKEIQKMRDYCDRWIAYEKELAQ